MTLRFGTDGVRAEAFSVLTVEYVRALGAAAAMSLGNDAFIVGRDTRESGPALQQAFAEGCAHAGSRILDAGVAPTPAVAWLSAAHGLPAAVLSASHNPWTDNGVKLFAPGGLKLDDGSQHVIQDLLDDGLSPDEVEPDVDAVSIDGYIDAVVDTVEGRGLSGSRVVIDCANGASTSTAERIFSRLGADVVAIAASPDGRNINDGVGSNNPEHLSQAVRKHSASVGFAFDGDADRLVACGSNGTPIDGDRILAMGAIDRRDHGRLAHNTVVITVMANLGFRLSMAQHGIDIVETAVGDRYVLEAMDDGGYVFGGEQSGHIIHRDLATTGDGVLSAVQLLDAAICRGLDVGMWAESVMDSYPQVLENVAVTGSIDDRNGELAAAIEREERLLGAKGRVLVRASGTEPLVRVMVEAADDATAAASAARLVEVVELMANAAAAD